MSATSKPSTAELVAELRELRTGSLSEPIGSTRWAVTACLAIDRAISALTAPLSADREAVADLLALHVRNINRMIVSGLHERDAIYEATDAILALTAPRGAGEDPAALK
jgi:hypothetical protein